MHIKKVLNTDLQKQLLVNVDDIRAQTIKYC